MKGTQGPGHVSGSRCPGRGRVKSENIGASRCCSGRGEMCVDVMRGPGLCPSRVAVQRSTRADTCRLTTHPSLLKESKEPKYESVKPEDTVGDSTWLKPMHISPCGSSVRPSVSYVLLNFRDIWEVMKKLTRKRTVAIG